MHACVRLKAINSVILKIPVDYGNKHPRFDKCYSSNHKVVLCGFKRKRHSGNLLAVTKGEDSSNLSMF